MSGAGQPNNGFAQGISAEAPSGAPVTAPNASASPGASVNTDFTPSGLAAADNPAPAAPEPPAPVIPTTLGGQIDLARQNGYSDDDIAAQVEKSKQWGPKFRQALEQGYTKDDIYDYMGLKLTPPKPITPLQGAYWDQVFPKTYAGRVLGAFGAGFSIESGGYDFGHMGSEQQKTLDTALQKAGIYNDIEKGQNDVLKSVNEALLRPLAVLLSTAAAAPEAGLAAMSGLYGGTQLALQEMGVPKDVTHVFEALPTENMLEGLNLFMRGGIAASMARMSRFSSLENELKAAREARVIGDSEAGFQGLTEPPPHVPDANVAAAVQDAKTAAVEHAGPAGEPPASAVPPEAPPAADLHTVARQIDPPTFQAYDALTMQRDTLREQIARESNPTPAMLDDLALQRSQLEAALDAANPRSPEARSFRRQLADLEDQRQDMLDRQKAWEAGEHTDSAVIQNLHRQLTDTQYQMLDLSPQVTAAYNEAAKRVEGGLGEAETPTNSDKTPTGPAETPTNSDKTPTGSVSLPPGVIAPVGAETPIAKPLVNIVDDVTQKLTAAGRPPEEANAAAQIVAAHYEARAARFNGKKGTAADLYAKEAPDIRAGKTAVARQAAEEMAQGRKRMTPGKINLNDGRAVITLFGDADASTFLHETGHAWLEEMMRDAADPDATAQMKADAANVHEWLGTEDGKTIPTKAHEKFARGFERYMMEGVAPTKALARVFEQFRNWLTAIYRTVTKLRAPITDDIRDVFDRLLTNDVERTAVAHESPGRVEASLHEEDAARTPPEHADATADHLAGEMATVAGRHEPEIKDGIATARSDAAPASQAGGVAERGPLPDGATAPAQPVPGETGAAGEPAAVGAGGNPAAEQGNPVPGEPAADPVGNAAGPAPAAAGSTAAVPGGNAPAAPGGNAPAVTGAHDAFGPSPADLIDKAGNIRLELTNWPDDVKEALRQLAADNNDFMDARRGVVPDATRVELAALVNATAGDVNMERLRATALEDGVSPSTRLQAARMWIPQAAQALREAAETARRSGLDEDVVKAAEAKLKLNMFAETLSGATAEWGRSGRALQDMRRMMATVGAEFDLDGVLRTATGRDLNQTRAEMRMVADLDTPARVAKFSRDSMKPDFWDKAAEWQAVALISNPITHAIYAVGNALTTLERATVKPVLAAAFDSAREALFGEAEPDIKRFRRQGAVYEKGVRYERKLPTGEFEPFDAEATDLLGSSPVARREKIGPDVYERQDTPGRVYWGEAQAAMYALARATPQGLKAGLRALTTGEVVRLPGEAMDQASPFLKSTWDHGAIPNYKPVVMGREIPIPLGGVLRLSGRMANAIHATARYQNFYRSISQQAYGIAKMEGLEGHAFKARVAELETSPTAQMMRTARDDANQSALMGRGGDFTQKLVELSNTRMAGTKIPKLIIPFARVSGNLLEQGVLHHSVLGLADSDVRADLRGVNGGRARSQRAAEIAFGSSLGLAAVLMMAQDRMTGGEPTDPKERIAWQQAGKLPYSVLPPFSHTWIPYGRFGVLSKPVGLAADLYQIADQADHMTLLNGAFMVAQAFSRLVLDESAMRGVRDLLDAFQDQHKLANWATNFSTSFIPYVSAVRQAARWTDGTVRSPQTAAQSFESVIPGLSQNVPPRLDVFGQPESYHQLYSPENQDPTVKYLNALQDRGVGVWPAMPERKLRGVKLTDDQYQYMVQKGGVALKSMLDRLVRVPGFSALEDGVQAEKIQQVTRQARAIGEQALFMQDAIEHKADPQNTILYRAKQQKLELAHTGKKPTP